MKPTVDFVLGADSMAAGLSRAQRPLLAELRRSDAFSLRSVHFHVSNPKLLFPFVYGPLPLWLTMRRPNLIHLANSWYAHLVPLLPAPVVVTCHDLIELERAEDPESKLKAHRRFHARATFSGMMRATLIVCDSHAVANQIVARAPSAIERIRVVYLGIDSHFRPGAVDERDLQSLQVLRPYVLFVGSEQQRKNLPRLVAAIARARGEIPGLKLVKVGASQFPAGRESFLDALRQEGIRDSTVILDHVTDAELMTLYRGALLTALPSLSEGFGFPPLEAMACGCPALVSDRGSLPEVMAEASMTVNPLDVSEMKDAIIRVATHQDYAKQLTLRGLERVRSYTWPRCAAGYEALYAEALGQP